MRAALLILLFSAPVVWAQTTGDLSESPYPTGYSLAQSSSAACVDSLSQDIVGLDAADAACPGLKDALLADEYAAFLSEEQIAKLTRRSLQDLVTIQTRYSGGAAMEAPAPSTASLGAVLESLEQKKAAEPPQGWFSRFKEWLRERLSRQQANEDSWLARWLEDFTLSERVTRALWYGVVIMIFGLALAVIVSEARAAGLFRRRKYADRPRAGAPNHDGAPPSVSLDLDSASLHAQPSVLLRMLVGVLVSAGRLPVERSLTHRELSARAAFDDVDQQASFQRVADLAERMLYGHGAALSDAEQIISEGRSLYARLSAAAS